jgi:hypothetical protein
MSIFTTTRIRRHFHTISVSPSPSSSLHWLAPSPTSTDGGPVAPAAALLVWPVVVAWVGASSSEARIDADDEVLLPARYRGEGGLMGENMLLGD